MEFWKRSASAGEDPKTTVLRAIDKLDRLGVRGVQQLLGRSKDESGDFTKGAGLDGTINL